MHHCSRNCAENGTHLYGNRYYSCFLQRGANILQFGGFGDFLSEECQTLSLAFFKTIKANGATGVGVAVYGNRAYDDGLIELRDIMTECQFKVAAMGAFVGEHTFSRVLGSGRPDSHDFETAKEFAAKIATSLDAIQNNAPGLRFQEIEVPGTPYPYSGFYKATDRDKKSVDIRKVLPKTDLTKCNRCGKCIKCGACIKRCPQGAKYFDDPQYLSHLKLLEEKFTSPRKVPELFIASLDVNLS